MTSAAGVEQAVQEVVALLVAMVTTEDYMFLVKCHLQQI